MMIIANNNGLILIRRNHLEERNWRDDTSYKFIFSFFGKSVYQTHYEDLTIHVGEFFIFNPNEPHKQLKVTQEKFLIEIEPEVVKEAAIQLGIEQPEPEFSAQAFRHPLISQWASFIHNYFIQQEAEELPANDLFLDNSVAQLTILLLQFGLGSHQKELPTIQTKTNIDLVVNALKENYTEDWSLDQMANISGLNKYQFAHQFKEETGISPYSWLQLYRLFKSQHSLINTDESILSIALEHGFKNISSYNRLFMKMYRKTPTEFRKIYRRK